MQIVFKTTHAAMPNVEKTKPETDIDFKKIEKKTETDIEQQFSTSTQLKWQVIPKTRGSGGYGSVGELEMRSDWGSREIETGWW